MTEQITPAKGNVIGEKTFSLSGKDIPTLEGLKVRVVYKNMDEVLQYALGQTVVQVQSKLRKAILAHQPIPFKPGVLVTVDAQGNHTLSPEEKERMMIEGALAKARESMSVKRAMLRGMGVSEEEIERIVGSEEGSQEHARTVPPEEGEFEENQDFKYSFEWLSRQDLGKLRVIAQNESLEGYGELDREQLLEELGLIERV